ncbi:hypothetical protein GQX74_009377 [Glossina fuscipes]|nr:hypothetical protein GQX74_009377 [Glossina fuscipes]
MKSQLEINNKLEKQSSNVIYNKNSSLADAAGVTRTEFNCRIFHQIISHGKHELFGSELLSLDMHTFNVVVIQPAAHFIFYQFLFVLVNIGTDFLKDQIYTLNISTISHHVRGILIELAIFAIQMITNHLLLASTLKDECVIARFLSLADFSCSQSSAYHYENLAHPSIKGNSEITVSLSIARCASNGCNKFC